MIRGFKDKNLYDLQETYAPVSRLPLIRAVLAIINKYDLEVCQMDVKTAFLNGTLTDEVYMEIPEGLLCSKETKANKVCKLQKGLYGLKVSPKRWNEIFTEIASKIGLKSYGNEPCLFTWRNESKFLILILYVDDILLFGNDLAKMIEIKRKLMREFEMTDLGETISCLGLELIRNREKKELKLTQTNYIDRMLQRFDFADIYPKATPMITNQVANRERKVREET